MNNYQLSKVIWHLILPVHVSEETICVVNSFMSWSVLAHQVKIVLYVMLIKAMHVREIARECDWIDFKKPLLFVVFKYLKK